MKYKKAKNYIIEDDTLTKFRTGFSNNNEITKLKNQMASLKTEVKNQNTFLKEKL